MAELYSLNNHNNHNNHPNCNSLCNRLRVAFDAWSPGLVASHSTRKRFQGLAASEGSGVQGREWVEGKQGLYRQLKVLGESEGEI
jgi:hypothetical protein